MVGSVHRGDVEPDAPSVRFAQQRVEVFPPLVRMRDVDVDARRIACEGPPGRLEASAFP